VTLVVNLYNSTAHNHTIFCISYSFWANLSVSYFYIFCRS